MQRVTRVSQAYAACHVFFSIFRYVEKIWFTIVQVFTSCRRYELNNTG